MHQYILIFQGLYQFNLCMKQFNAICLFVCSLSVAVAVASCNVPKHAITTAGEQSGNPNAMQHHANPYPVIQQKYFLNTWTGTESCENNAQNPSSVTLTARDSLSVFISGLFNTADKLEGTIRGYVVIIKQQTITLMPKGCTIDGTLILSNDHQTLNGYFKKQINGQVDSCNAVYHLAK